MQTHIIKNGVVVNTILATVAEAQAAYPDATCIDGSVGGIGWQWNGVELHDPYQPNISDIYAALQDSIVAATQTRLDDFAKTRNYDGILSLCTYATSTVPKFQAEGQYGVTARDATWATLYAMLAEVEAGTRPMPTGFADVEPELPILEWPN